MKSPLFSVIIATHNREQSLRRAIESVLKQTFGDFELIIVDNGSTDGTRSVVEAMEDPRIRYVANDKPTNSCDVPRNIGMGMANGEYIAFLDDDDIWYPSRLEKVKMVFDANPGRSCVCHNENKAMGGRVVGTFRYGPWSEDLYERLLYDGNCLSSCGTTISAGLLRRFGGFDKRPQLSEVADYDLWIRMAKEGVRIDFIEEPLGEFTVTGLNWSIRNPHYQAKLARMIRRRILECERGNIGNISKRGSWRLSQLYLISARCYLKAGLIVQSLSHLIAALYFLMRYPGLIIELFGKLRKGRNDAGMPSPSLR